MIYTKTTGKFIGECMTGFGISYPVSIYNYGNSEVVYTIDSNDSNFSSSVSSLTIPNGSQGQFDIYFDSTINGVSGYESGIFSITSESVEDGSIDPSGNIYLYITGHRIADTTGGHVRNFRALKNYDVDKGLSYDFYWLNPTGTGNLYNYFITGYKLEIATGDSFSAGTIVGSKFLAVPLNNSLIPRYGSYNGLDVEEQTTTISEYDDQTPFQLNTAYYARIYSIVDNGVTGESVFATGIDAYNQPVSEEVATGNISNKLDIRFAKKSLDVYLPESLQEINYNLYNTIVENNNDSNNLKYISEINVYFQSDTSLLGGSQSSYPLNLEGTFLNFTGDPSTNINLYLHETTEIYGKFGKGGDIDGIFDPTSQNNKYNNPQEYINNTLSKYASSTICTPAENGGSLFNFKVITNVQSEDRKDINYNVFSKYGSKIAAGGAGTDASIGFVDNFGGAVDARTFIGYGNDKNKTYFKTYFSLGGNENLLQNEITSLDLYQSVTTLDSNGIKTNIASTSAGKYSSYPSIYGEDNSSYKVPYFKPSVYTDFKWDKIIGNNIAYAQYIPDYKYFTQKAAAGSLSTFWYRPIKQNPDNYTVAGKIVDSFTESKVSFNFDNDNLPSDFVFRFANDGISSTNWTNTTSVATLAGSTDASIFNNSLYSFVGKNSITLSSNEYLQCNFSSITSLSTQNCQNFDLFLVIAYRPVKIEADSKYIVSNKLAGVNQYNYSKFKILDWFDNSKPNNITEDQILINNFPGIKTPFTNPGQSIPSVLLAPDLLYYPKEPNMFQFFINPLVNGKVLNRVNEDSAYAPDARYELWKMIVQINPNLVSATNVAQNNALNNYTYLLNNPIQISRSLLNATDYYPMIMNIRRTGSTMTIFVNGISVISYDLNTFIADANNHIIKNLSNSTLKLISKCDDVVGGNKESMSYFDIMFYNRNLTTSELNSLHTNLIKEYFKLFTGSSLDLNIKSNRIRLPNVFNLTGR
jgi:hypothetical protein